MGFNSIIAYCLIVNERMLQNFPWTPFNKIEHFFFLENNEVSKQATQVAMANVHEIYYKRIYQMTTYTQWLYTKVAFEE